MMCETCHREEVPTGESNFYMEVNKMCLKCFIFLCDCGMLYEESLSYEEGRKAIKAWNDYCRVVKKK